MTTMTKRPQWADAIASDRAGNLHTLTNLDGDLRIVVEQDTEEGEIFYSWGIQERRLAGWVEVASGYGVSVYYEPLSWLDVWVEFQPAAERLGWTDDDVLEEMEGGAA
jgi:hypothetical protein